MEKITVEVTRDFLFEACALAYSRWSAEYDLLKQVKAEKDDGQPDYARLHAIRLKNHTETVAKWDKFRLEASELVAKLRLI